MAKQSTLTKGEKRLLYCVSAFVIISLAVVLWLQYAAIDPVVTIPSPIMPSPNACDFYLKAMKSFVACPVQTPHGADTFDYNDLNAKSFYYGIVHGKNRQDWKPTLAELLKLQQLNMPAFATLRQGFKHNYDGSSLSDDELGEFYRLGFHLDMDAKIRRMSGDWNGAVNDGIDAIYLGDDMARGSSIEGTRNGISVQATGQSGCRGPVGGVWIDIDHLNAAEARAAARRMEEIALRHTPLTQVLQQDKLDTQAALLKLFNDANWRKNISPAFRMVPNFAFSPIADDSPFPILLTYTTSKRQIFEDCTRYINALIVHAGKHYAIAGAEPPIPQNFYSRYLLLDKALLGYSRIRMTETSCEAQNSLLMVSLALRAYRLEHSGYPRTLATLTPSYLQSIPCDPFGAGEALHYKCSGSSYTLYSIGPDGKDDGGKPIVATMSCPFIDYKSIGDIVAGVNLR